MRAKRCSKEEQELVAKVKSVAAKAAHSLPAAN